MCPCSRLPQLSITRFWVAATFFLLTLSQAVLIPGAERNYDPRPAESDSTYSGADLDEGIQLGNAKKLLPLVTKLRAGIATKTLVLGGSHSLHVHTDTKMQFRNYAGLFVDLLNLTYPALSHLDFTLARGGTPSCFWATHFYLVLSELKALKPDLLILEFSPNDWQVTPHDAQGCVEKLVLLSRQQLPELAFIVLELVDERDLMNENCTGRTINHAFSHNDSPRFCAPDISSSGSKPLFFDVLSTQEAMPTAHVIY